MTLDQKRALRELLRESIDGGFGIGYPLKRISILLGLKEPLYDDSTNTGLLWEFGPHGEGLIDARGDWPDSHASIDYHYGAPLIEAWTHPSQEPKG
jgi:hypothetical protein